MRGSQSPADAPTRVASRLILGGDWYRPGESLWGAIQKLALLNPLPPAAFEKLLLSEEGKRSTLGSIDLRCWGPIAIEKFASALRLLWSASDIALATLEPFSLSEVVPASRFSQFGCGVPLRYCPICLQQGLHSTIHQLPYVVSCPWHNVRIKDRCRHGAPVPYELSRKSLLWPMCCEHGERLWPASTARRWGATLSERQVDDVRALARWIAKQKGFVPPLELVSRGSREACDQAVGIDSARSEIQLVPFLHGLVRGPEWLDIACPPLQQGETIRRQFPIRWLDADPGTAASASIHRIPTTTSLPGILAGRNRGLDLPSFRGFEARFVGWVRQRCLQHLARFKARYLDSHQCYVTGRPTFDRIGCRKVCLVGEAYRLCDSRVGISHYRPQDVREWFFCDADDLDLFAIQLAALLDIFARHELLRTSSTRQRNEVLRWFAREVAEVVVMRSLESSLTGVLLDCLERSPWSMVPRLVDGRYLFPGEAAFTPIVLAIEGPPATITMHSRTELSAEHWQRVTACTQICDLLSSPEPDPTLLGDLLESCGLTALRNLDGRAIREHELAEWKRRCGIAAETRDRRPH